MNRTIFNTISNPQYLLLLQKCSTMYQLKQIHAQTITLGLARFTYIASKLLAFCAMSDVDYAHAIFNQITMPTVFDYNSIILGYSKTSKPETGFSVYTQMCIQGVEPNARTYPVLINACHCMSPLCQVHGQIVKLGNVSDVFVISSLICTYSKFKAIKLAKQVFEESSYRNVVCCTSLITGCFSNGLVDEAQKVFDEMPERNIVSYSAMISGLVRNELFNEAIELFHQFKNYGIMNPNRSLLISILSACGAVGALDQGRSIHHELVDDSFDKDLELGTALIDFYAKCGDIEKAQTIFSKMHQKDVATWSAMILGLATNGKKETAINLFKEMEQKGPVPNDVTFIGVLIACNHRTLVKEAWRLFGRMFKVYNLRPVIEHFGCMVDLLARSGQLKGAERLIKSMPVQPDGAIWGSFLHGCLTHGETRLAEKAGKILIELEPEHSGRYVLLANMYAGMESWDGVIRLRNMMIKRKVATDAGWSFVEVDGIVHKFMVDDQWHPRTSDLYEVLQVLNKVSMSSSE